MGSRNRNGFRDPSKYLVDFLAITQALKGRPDHLNHSTKLKKIYEYQNLFQEYAAYFRY